MAKNQHTFAKRQREIEKRRKAEEKRAKRQRKKEGLNVDPDQLDEDGNPIPRSTIICARFNKTNRLVQYITKMGTRWHSR